MKNQILIKTPQNEMDLSLLCEKQYKKINFLLNAIEKEFDTDMNNHQDLRHEILNISNFIKRLPTMISEVVNNES